MFLQHLNSTGQLLIIILVLLLLKHFLADYPLQNKWMLGKTKKTHKKDGIKVWFKPLVAHAAVHGALTSLFLLAVISPIDAFRLGLLDFVFHFFIDLWKCRGKQYHNFQKEFWFRHGLDQLFHETSYVILAFLAVFLSGV